MWTCVSLLFVCTLETYKHPTVTADALFFLSFSFLLFHFPTEIYDFCRNKRDRLETLAKCASSNTFFQNSDLRSKNLRPFFTVSSLSFNKSDCLDFIANDEWPQFTQPQSTGLSGLGKCWSLYKSCNRSQNQFLS